VAPTTLRCTPGGPLLLDRLGHPSVPP
jgi:hypothetical protein